MNERPLRTIEDTKKWIEDCQKWDDDFDPDTTAGNISYPCIVLWNESSSNGWPTIVYEIIDARTIDRWHRMIS